MPIDFSQIKKITIPEGDVKSISVGGVVIWEEASTPKVLTSITLSGQTTSLNRGASFSFGGTVTAHYSDSSTADVTSSTTFSGYNMSVAGTYTVTASYTEDGVTKTATYTLTVNKAWTQVWSGSKSISWSQGTNWQSNKPSNVTVWNNPGMQANGTYRVTFTMSNKLSNGHYLNFSNTGWTLSSKPGSPYQWTFSTLPTAGSNNIIGVESASGSGGGSTQARLVFQYYRLNASSIERFQLAALTGNTIGTAPSGTISITVTKIERYY